MTDTQWPRFEVFVQARADRPHEHAGSVHAPDPELALLNARDVFVRRPACHSLWVMPAQAVLSATREGLAGVDPSAGASASRFLVFTKTEPRGTLTHVGELDAPDGAAALRAAAESDLGREALVIWVAPEQAIARSDPADAESMFAPAEDRPYRDQAFYHVQTRLRELRRKAGR